MNQDLLKDQSLSDWFFAKAHHPALPGPYEVRNSEPMGKRARMRLIGRFRYWNGSRWFTDETCRFESVFGEHRTHQWRGVRMWVVQTTNSRLKPGELLYVCWIKSGRRRTVSLDANPQRARPFSTKGEAETYIGGFPRHALEYDLQAVLA